MKGITFGNYHSYDDFHLILGSQEIGSPDVKENKIKIEGADGDLDFTDFFGSPKYENVRHKFNFSTIVSQAEFFSLFSTVKNAIHGKKLRIILDDDPLFYYIGRCFVSKFTNEKGIGIVSVECDCEPYKYKIDTTGQPVYLCEKNLLNLDYAVIPTVIYDRWSKTETGYSYDKESQSGNGYLHFNIPVIKGHTYTFSAIGTTYTGYPPTLIIYSDKVIGDVVARSVSTFSVTFVAQKTGFYVFALIANSATETVNFTNVMVTENDTVEDFEAYDSTQKSKTIVFSNCKKTAVPTIHMIGALTVTSNGISLNIENEAQQTQLLPEVEFMAGENSVDFVGNGVAVVEWQEGSL